MPVFIDKNFMTEKKDSLKNSDYYEIKQRLKLAAERAYSEKYQRITDLKAPVDIDIHSYYSELAYRWPIEGSQGKYENRDGERWPGRFCAHHDAMKALCIGSMIMSSAGYYLEDRKFLDKTAELMKEWFVDSQTAMAPNFSCAQSLRFVHTGSFYGIIEGAFLLYIIQSAGLLEAAGGYDELLKGVRKWFSSLLDWLCNSEFGQNEKKTKNNHAIWYNTIVSSIASFVGDDAVFKDTCENFCNLMDQQIGEDGFLTKELTRTNSYFYSFFTMEAMTLMYEVARIKGVDLWGATTNKGRSMTKLLDTMLPYYINPFLWKYSEISGNIVTDSLTYQIAALRLCRNDYQKANIKRQKQLDPLRPRASRIGYLFLLPGYDSDINEK